MNIITLGCSKNMVDSEVLSGQLQANDIDVVHENKKSDHNIVVVNTCGFIDKAKEELRLTKEMFTEMEKDGLIDPKQGFTIEYKNKDLYIDGKKQSAKTTDKYRKYFKKDHFKMTIEKE